MATKKQGRIVPLRAQRAADNFPIRFTACRFNYGFLSAVYFIKIKGKVRIPDYIQIRDEQMKLLVYCRADRPEEALRKAGLEHLLPAVQEAIAREPYGKIIKMKHHE